uniref:Uncharacterized protein n=1 Tax=Romanomermis culicivorax TaxID=13658 RepID=A0A915L7X0_ROMCU
MSQIGARLTLAPVSLGTCFTLAPISHRLHSAKLVLTIFYAKNPIPRKSEAGVPRSSGLNIKSYLALVRGTYASSEIGKDHSKIDQIGNYSKLRNLQFPNLK